MAEKIGRVSSPERYCRMNRRLLIVGSTWSPKLTRHPEWEMWDVHQCRILAAFDRQATA